MKIIKIKGCHQCDKYAESVDCEGIEWECKHPDRFGNYFLITEYYDNKTLPYDCPLEEDVLHKMMKEKIFVLWKMVSQT